MDEYDVLHDLGGGFCVPLAGRVEVCVDKILLDALDQALQKEYDEYGEYEPTTSLHDVVVEGIYQFLKQRGRLPDPYV